LILAKLPQTLPLKPKRLSLSTTEEIRVF